MENKCLFVSCYQQKFGRKLKEHFLIDTNFLTMITISLFYCGKKKFIVMNIWVIEKNLMKHHYLEKKIFTVT